MKNYNFRKIISTILLASQTIFAAENIFLSITKEGIPYSSLPVNTIIVSKQEIQNSGTKTIGELLDKLTPLDFGHIGTLGAMQTVRLRNSTANQVLILLNCIPLNSIAKGNVNLANLSTEAIEKIEILYGSASAIYGANAVAGIVNIITEKPSSTVPEIKSNITYGNFQTLCYNALFDFMKSDYGLNFNLSKKSSQGWRENSDYNSIDGYVNFTKHFDTNKLNLFILSHNSELGIPGATPIPKAQWDGVVEKKANTPYARQFDNNIYLLTSYETKIFKSNLGLSQENLVYDNSKAPTFLKDKTDSNLKGITLNNSLSLPYNFTASLDFVYNTLTQEYPLTPTNNFTKDISNLGLMIQNQVKQKGIEVIPSLRYDTNSYFGSKFSPQGIFIYSQNNTKVSFSVGSSWRAPTFLDLFWPDMVWAKGNPELIPEESYSIDLGIEQTFGVVNLVINPFYRYIYNQIRWYSEKPEDWTIPWRPTNVDKAISRGIDLKINFVPLSMWHNKINFIVSESKVYKKGEEDKGWQNQAYSPVFTGVYSMIIDLPYKISVNSDLKYVDVQYATDYTDETKARITKFDPFTIWDLKLTKKLGDKFDLFFKINDVLDQKGVNRVNYPLPGRNCELGLNMTFVL